MAGCAGVLLPASTRKAMSSWQRRWICEGGQGETVSVEVDGFLIEAQHDRHSKWKPDKGTGRVAKRDLALLPNPLPPNGDFHLLPGGTRDGGALLTRYRLFPRSRILVGQGRINIPAYGCQP